MLTHHYNGRLSDTVAYTHNPEDCNNPFRFYDLTSHEANIHLGTTNFFRHPMFFQWLARQVNQWNGDAAPRILAAPCCVGAETYSLAAVFQKAGCFDRFPKLTISAFDISAEFTRTARKAVYPLAMKKHIQQAYKDGFKNGNTHLHIAENLKKHVRILSSRDMTKSLRLKPFDIVITSNLLMHLKDDAQKAAMLDNLCTVSGSLLCLNNLTQDARRNMLMFHYRLKNCGFSVLQSSEHESLTVFARKSRHLPHYLTVGGHA